MVRSAWPAALAAAAYSLSFPSLPLLGMRSQRLFSSLYHRLRGVRLFFPLDKSGLAWYTGDSARCDQLTLG